MADADLQKIVVRIGADFQDFTDAVQSGTDALEGPLQTLRDKLAAILEEVGEKVRDTGQQIVDNTELVAEAVIEIDGKKIEVLKANEQELAEFTYEQQKIAVFAYEDQAKRLYQIDKDRFNAYAEDARRDTETKVAALREEEAARVRFNAIEIEQAKQSEATRVALLRQEEAARVRFNAAEAAAEKARTAQAVAEEEKRAAARIARLRQEEAARVRYNNEERAAEIQRTKEAEALDLEMAAASKAEAASELEDAKLAAEAEEAADAERTEQHVSNAGKRAAADQESSNLSVRSMFPVLGELRTLTRLATGLFAVGILVTEWDRLKQAILDATADIAGFDGAYRQLMKETVEDNKALALHQHQITADQYKQLQNAKSIAEYKALEHKFQVDNAETDKTSTDEFTRRAAAQIEAIRQRTEAQKQLTELSQQQVAVTSDPSGHDLRKPFTQEQQAEVEKYTKQIHDLDIQIKNYKSDASSPDDLVALEKARHEGEAAYKAALVRIEQRKATEHEQALSAGKAAEHAIEQLNKQWEAYNKLAEKQQQFYDLKKQDVESLEENELASHRRIDDDAAKQIDAEKNRYLEMHRTLLGANNEFGRTNADILSRRKQIHFELLAVSTSELLTEEEKQKQTAALRAEEERLGEASKLSINERKARVLELDAQWMKVLTTIGLINQETALKQDDAYLKDAEKLEKQVDAEITKEEERKRRVESTEHAILQAKIRSAEEYRRFESQIQKKSVEDEINAIGLKEKGWKGLEIFHIRQSFAELKRVQQLENDKRHIEDAARLESMKAKYKEAATEIDIHYDILASYAKTDKEKTAILHRGIDERIALLHKEHQAEKDAGAQAKAADANAALKDKLALMDKAKASMDQFAGATLRAGIAAAISGEKVGRAMAKAAKATLASIAEESGIQAIYSVALGFLRLAQHRPDEATEAFTAAAQFGVIAGVAGGASAAIHVGGGSGSGSSGSGSGSGSPGSGSGSGGGNMPPGYNGPGSGGLGQTNGRTIQLNVYGHVFADDLQTLATKLSSGVDNGSLRLSSSSTAATPIPRA